MEIYEEICDKCNGNGFILQVYQGIRIGEFCRQCNGAGTLDWVQKVTGVRYSKLHSDSITRKRIDNIQRLTQEGYQLVNSIKR